LTADEVEPTPRVGPCIEETGIIDEETSRQLFALFEPKEHNFIDLLVFEDEGTETFLRVMVGLDCLHVFELHVVGCGEKSVEALKKLYDKPEFTRLVLQGNCVELIAPWNPPMRIKQALRLFNIEIPVVPKAYRPSDIFTAE